MNDHRPCDLCGVLCASEQTEECDGQHICLDCAAQETVVCDHCFDQYYARCRRCGWVIPYDEVSYLDDNDDCPLCHECYTREERKTRVIHDYSYKPEPLFHGSGPRFFGVELEIDEGGECQDFAQEILDAGNPQREAHIYCKHDGSICDGFEIVTHPASLDYHMNSLPWPEILGTARRLERWAARYGYREHPWDILHHAKSGYHSGRYTCVNLENRATVEFRMFRGSLKLNTVLATLQMVDRICDVALFLSDEELKALSWTTFVSGCTQPELVQYLKERRLYVNEPVSGGEEEV